MRVRRMLGLSQALLACILVSQPSRSAAKDDPPKGWGRLGKLSFVPAAVQSGDPAQLADAALLMAESERVLGRADDMVSAKTLFDAALRAATEMRDGATLDRLGRVADRTGDEELKSRVAAARKLAGAARADSDAIAVLVTDVDAPTYGYLKWLRQGAHDARVWNDPRLVTPLQWAVESPGRVPVSLHGPLQRLLQETRAALEGAEENTSESLDALRRLAAPSRARSIFGQWRSGGRIADFDPSGWLEIRAANGNSAVFQFSIDDSTGNPDFWILTGTDKTGYTSRGIIQWIDDDRMIWRGDIGALTYQRIP